VALEGIDYIDNFRSNKNNFLIMETAIEKLNKLMQYADKESLTNLSEGIDKVLEGVDLKKTGLRVKVAWVLGNQDDPGSYLSLDFKIG
jgi:hypothetical protein